MNCRHVEQALAGKAAFLEQVLVNLGTRSAIGVHAKLAGKQPMKARSCVDYRQRRDDTRLQDAITTDHALAGRVQLGLVIGMGSNAHQIAQTSWRQLGVTVQGDHVACLQFQLRQRPQVQKHSGVAGGQRGHQRLQLAALAFPADPGLFGKAEAARTVEQDEAKRFARVTLWPGMQLIKRGHFRLRMGQ
ncbi:hypothetical protein GALL_539710 [mine drainage metagenome]|uniref:Uncharacterized protein n=1 Tax=mine drainage metagenome TaxID=410659 RepID=A0A1J5P066_9ZZZZ